MSTDKQDLGDMGEKLVAERCACPKCKRTRTLKCLPKNFKCADVICDFCGYLAQVKTASSDCLDVIPNRVLGAAWGPQKERMNASIFFPLFLVLSTNQKKSGCAIYYLSADLQTADIYVPRKPLGPHAKRSGWQGFIYDVSEIKDRFVRLI
ncbi:MAG: hypothetical protein EBQ96_00995 [Proteobacteria bacterium]|nr:hypothetical protein [Pseudomonadota bacterium]